MILHPDLRDLLAAFAKHSVEYLLIGGYAVAVQVVIDGIAVRVVNHADLRTLKLASGRPQDLVDAKNLE